MHRVLMHPEIHLYAQFIVIVNVFQLIDQLMMNNWCHWLNWIIEVNDQWGMSQWWEIMRQWCQWSKIGYQSLVIMFWSVSDQVWFISQWIMIREQRSFIELISQRSEISFWLVSYKSMINEKSVMNQWVLFRS